MTRGYRNNNPGNIRKNSDVFQGEVNPSQDKEFKQFKTMAYGYRAVFKILMTYHKKYHLNTIRMMIGRWAPPEENHTENYIKTVCDVAGMNPDGPVDTGNRELMIRIVAGISRVENGRNADMVDIIDGWNML